MIISYFCIFLAFLLNYLTKIPVARAMSKLGGYDNKNPRTQQSRLEGWGRRALSAHLNSFETFPAFAIAVIIAQINSTQSALISQLSIGYIVTRVLFILFYLKNDDKLRSAAFGFGLAITGYLFYLGFTKGT